MDERTQQIMQLIESYYASDIPTDEKLQTAREMFKKLAEYNRRVAEARGTGKESRLTPKMPKDVILATMTGNREAVENWYRSQ